MVPVVLVWRWRDRATGDGEAAAAHVPLREMPR